jgi:hypothetical protein
LPAAGGPEDVVGIESRQQTNACAGPGGLGGMEGVMAAACASTRLIPRFQSFGYNLPEAVIE